MARRYFTYVVLLAGILGFPGIRVCSQEIWLGMKMDLPVLKSLHLEPEVQSRLHHDPNLRNYEYHYKLAVKYEINDHWKFGGTFRIKNAREESEMPKVDIPDRKRYTLEINADYPIWSTRVSVQNRLRYQVSQTKKLNYEHYVRYRIGLEHLLTRSIRISLSDEIYVECEDLSFRLNKTRLRVELRITDAVRTNLFYLIESNLRFTNPLFNYIVGCELEYKI